MVEVQDQDIDYLEYYEDVKNIQKTNNNQIKVG